MAVVKTTAAGAMSGSVGPITFSNWKGVDTARSKPTSVANPNTLPQQTQRSKFGELGKVGRKMLASLKTGLRNKAIKMSEINVFMALNKANVSYAAGTSTVDFNSLIVSQGSVGVPGAITNTAGTAPNNVGLQIADNSDGVVALPSDKLYLAVYDTVTKNSALIDTGKTRATAAVAWQQPIGAAYEGHNAHFYPFFRRATSSETSDNAHFAQVV